MTSDTGPTLTNLGASCERLARASIAAGFAMVEGLHDDPARELPKHPQSALRRTWQTLEHYLTRRLTGPDRPSSLSA
jgi:hypothetical protein